MLRKFSLRNFSQRYIESFKGQSFHSHFLPQTFFSNGFPIRLFYICSKAFLYLLQSFYIFASLTSTSAKASAPAARVYNPHRNSIDSPPQGLPLPTCRNPSCRRLPLEFAPKWLKNHSFGANSARKIVGIIINLIPFFHLFLLVSFLI